MFTFHTTSFSLLGQQEMSVNYFVLFSSNFKNSKLYSNIIYRATTGSRGRNLFLLAGGHGLLIQLFTAWHIQGATPGYEAMPARMEIRAASWIRTTDLSADRA